MRTQCRLAYLSASVQQKTAQRLTMTNSQYIKNTNKDLKIKTTTFKYRWAHAHTYTKVITGAVSMHGRRYDRSDRRF